jgi:hypothetical protein
LLCSLNNLEKVIINSSVLVSIMEIEMVEMGREKAADPHEFTTLASGLLKDYDMMEGNKHLIDKKTGRLTKSSIGNQALLPQQVRVRIKAKAADDARMSAYIEEENISDLALFDNIKTLKGCCRQTNNDLATPTNCILRGFTSDTTTFDFLACCYFVRR